VRCGFDERGAGHGNVIEYPRLAHNLVHRFPVPYARRRRRGFNDRLDLRMEEGT